MLLLVNQNYNKNQIQNAVLQPLAAAPASPLQGQMYYDTVALRPLYYSGTAWIDNSARANHTGTQLAATISDLATTVKAYTLDSFAAPVANVSMNGNKLTNLQDGLNPQDGATMNNLAAVAAGFVNKGNVVAMSIAPLPANTYNNAAGTITGNANGPAAAVDGYTPQLNEVVALVNEPGSLSNGLYALTQVGQAGVSPFIYTRTTNLNSSVKFNGAYFVIDESSVTQGGAQMLCNQANPVLGTTPITFTRINPIVTYLADGTTITKTGLTFSIATGYVGQASITTLGTITSGTWNGSTIATTKGGTGANLTLTPGAVIFGATAGAMGQTAAGTAGQPLLSAGAGTPTFGTLGIAAGGTGQTTAVLALAALGGTGKYAALIGDGVTTGIAVSHGLGTPDVNVTVRDAASGAYVYPDITVTSASVVTIAFAVAPTLNQYRVVVVG